MITAAQIQSIRNNDPGAVLPGIDTMTGNPYAAASLLDVTKITQKTNAPYYYSPSTNTVYVTQSGAVLSGINFGSATLMIKANNVTVEDCTFTGTTGFQAIQQYAGFSGATVENSTFIGSKSPTEQNIWIGSQLGITIEDNTFLNSPADSIAIEQGIVTGNYFSGEGYLTGAHADAIYVPATTGPVSITNNFIEETANAGQPGISNSDIRITDEQGNVNGVIISGNYLIGSGFSFEVAAPLANNTISNVSVTHNDIGFDWYGQYFPGTTNLATVTGIRTVDFSNPTNSTNALAAYVAAGVPTAPSGGSGPVTMMANGVASAQLGQSGSTETNFVGGYGRQILHGGQGVNILTYLALGDGGDYVTGFDPAKDVIDLSGIDGDILSAGVQNFTFIGSAPFSGGAQVRYQLDPTNSQTIVQAALVGDDTSQTTVPGGSMVDFSITLTGLVPLTAANFALTPSQSSAALTNGASLTYTKVTTAAGAPTEYAYSNVQGGEYTAYQAFYGPGYENLEADDLNLSSKANKLVLYNPSQTVTRGGGSETLTAGTGSDRLNYHSVETIDATTSGGEQFIFSSGFGKETIDGFSASGTSPDSIQLAKSAFSYLTASMTQAQDLAAVMAHASRGESGLTISDTHGDSLTLTRVTPTMVVVNPAMLEFT